MISVIRTRTHELQGSHLTSRDPSFEIMFRELPCNCGAAWGRYHTVHEGNPTGHSVGCPVFLRWAAADAAVAFAETLNQIIKVAQNAAASAVGKTALALNIQGRAEKVLGENSGWINP